MNQNQSSKTNLIIIAVIVIIAGIVLVWYLGGKNTDSSSTLDTQANSTTGTGKHVLALLNQTQELNIDTTLFDSIVFQSLQDYTVNIPPVNQGRPNPFAPLPGVKVPNIPKIK